MYYIFFGIIVFATFAMTVQHGVWSNLITLIAVLLGGITAFGVHQPLTVMADEATGGSYTYLLDFPILWGMFALTAGLVKEFAQMLSRNRVNFPDQLDGLLGAGIGLVTALILGGFAMATFHCAPFAYDQMGGAFEHGDKVAEVKSSLESSSSPDVFWLSAVDTALNPSALGAAGFRSDLWVHQHGQHRKTFQNMQESIVKR
ncbi:Colicin V production protein [Planctomycetes bacterium MalM25]|nr:Colicin V production protein [Planctomycetes bacterium MalM25]